MRPEEELIALCKKGDSSAQSELYKRFSKKLWGVCLRYAKNQMSAEDILQEGFIRIFKYLDQYKGEGSFEGWMRRTMVNTAINYYKKNLSSKDESDIDDMVGIQSDNADAVSQMSTDEILNLVQALPGGYRTVFNLYVMEGLSHKDIATQLNISENTSKSQLSRARSILQEKILNLYEKNDERKRKI